MASSFSLFSQHLRKSVENSVCKCRYLYNSRLFSSKNLLLTNSAITLVLSGAGDALSQRLQMKANKQKLCGGMTSVYNWQQTQIMVLASVPYGPMVHYWYQWLDRLIPGSGMRVVLKKIAFDQLLFSPVYVVLFLCTVSALEHHSSSKTSELWAQIKKDVGAIGPQLYAAECLVWPPAQFINFWLVPLKFRVLFDNVVSLAVDTYYSYVRFPKDTYNIPPETEVSRTAVIATPRHSSVVIVLPTCSGSAAVTFGDL